ETFLPHDLSAFQAYADEPSHFSWQGAVFGRRLREYLPSDSVLFCGSGSDQLFYRQPAILPWLLRRGKVRDFLASLRGCSRTLQRGTVNLAYQSLLATLPAYLSAPLLG